MTPAEVRDVLATLAGAWPWFATADEMTRLWRSSLAPLEYDPAAAAARKLAESEDRMPSLAAFLRAAHTEARCRGLAQHAVRPERAPCGLCDGTGWARAGIAGGGEVFAVLRCRCSSGRVSDQHPSACSCRRCYYGAQRAEDIAAGLDGFRRTGPDPLVQVGGRATTPAPNVGADEGRAR